LSVAKAKKAKKNTKKLDRPAREVGKNTGRERRREIFNSWLTQKGTILQRMPRCPTPLAHHLPANHNNGVLGSPPHQSTNPTPPEKSLGRRSAFKWQEI